MTNEAKKKQLPAFLVLTIISLVAAVVLAVTNEVTKGPIAEHAAAARTAAFRAVLPAAGYNEVAIPEGNDSVTACELLTGHEVEERQQIVGTFRCLTCRDDIFACFVPCCA